MIQGVHLLTKDGKLACHCRIDADTKTTTEKIEVTCPFCKGKRR